ncbi:ferrous iron transporter B [Oerskovia enterophila]|uniref:Ferrous iron transport protein B n=1 Tax=Oerskovia enterophila TaxID=43678 RepID=A0A161YJQ7_9CELL|nr:ferrous iron transporter B [Oerskovia enterophila]KZM36608.1 ferrous iron transport protein B [Oerskovia enterophila]
MSCPHCEGGAPRTHEGPDGAAHPRGRRAPGGGATTAPAPVLRVLLVGTPNAGKSTLFNHLTGARQTTRNVPGTTVDLARGTWRPRTGAGTTTATPLALVDLPGTYSLTPVSPDEAVTVAEIDRAGAEPGTVTLLVANAAELHSALFLLGQVGARTERVVVALTMTDVATADGVTVDPGRLAARLGVPVVEVDPRTGRGTDGLVAAVRAVSEHPRPVPGLPGAAAPGTAPDDELDRIDALLGWADDVVESVGAHGSATRSRADRIDALLLDPWVGLPVFVVTLWALFQLATWVAAPIMGATEALVTGPVAGLVTWALDGVGLSGGWLEGLLVDGLVAGVGVVVAFAPLMALMFLAIGLLEDSGYVARVAVLADRLMRSVGLDGRVIMPLIVGFGCNLPALAATRTLPNARQRLLTGLLIPYASCPARLTVYVLLAGTFFPRHTGLVVLAMYVLSVALVLVGALVLRGTLFRDLTHEPLALVLPAYHVPRPVPLLVTTGRRVLAFLRGAGTIIVGVLVVVWLLLSVPVTPGHTFGEVPVHDSAYGRLTDQVAPVFSPAGYGDWRTTSALVTGFVAKEVAVGALAQAYAVDEPVGSSPGELGEQLRATLDETSGGHAPAAALAFMVFVLAYTPCLATVAEQQRMFGWRWTLGAVAIQLSVAWVLSVATFQLLRLVW